MLTPENTTIAFIGTGVMGKSMAGHLVKAGYDVTVFNRSKERALPLLDAGCSWAETVAAAVYDADVVITMVGYPTDVEDIYLSKDGILESAKDGAYLIDMTTSSPRLARDIFAVAETSSLHAIDAPVSGGDLGAKNATLTIMVGGEEGDFEAVLPILKVMGKEIIHQGGAGAGQHTKMANQIAIAGSMLAVVECISYAKAAGLDPEKVLRSVGAGSASSWSILNLGPRILAEDFAPGFYVKHFIKDMGIALEEADEMEISLPGLETAKQLYDMLSAVGGAELGTQALWLLYADEDACAKHGLDWSLLELDDEDDECGCGDPSHHHHDHGDDCDCDDDCGDDCSCKPKASGSVLSDSPFLNEN